MCWVKERCVAEVKLTPLMQQYWDIKNHHQDKVLLFRMGDFFEMFHEDAIIAAPILNIALTQRNKKSDDETPMCGVPHHSVATPISKLLKAGHKVAICDQVEDPKEAKGLVKRAVTQILTPGMVFDPESLEAGASNYICCFDSKTVSFLEASTHEAFYFNYQSQHQLLNLIETLNPAELLLDSRQKAMLQSLKSGFLVWHVTLLEEEVKNSQDELLSYVKKLQPELSLEFKFSQKLTSNNLEISPTVIRNLELFKTYSGEKKGSFFHAVNRCKTSMGARKLKSWIQFPLIDPVEIEKRHNCVEHFVQNMSELKLVRESLSKMYDIERRLAKIESRQATPLDLVSLKDSLLAGLRAHKESLNMPYNLNYSVDVINSVISDIDKIIAEEPPSQMKNGGYIKKGVYSELDEYIEYDEKAQEKLRELEERERSETGISTLKIRHNNVFGYYIEVTKVHSDKVPPHYHRKQTLTNAERYIHEELKKIEEKIFSSKSKRLSLEQKIFDDLKAKVLACSEQLLMAASDWAFIDVMSSFAWLSIEFNYSRPIFDKNINLKANRHPVVEQFSKSQFVSNDFIFNKSDCLLLTGPNMAGKSTFMRQLALTVIMAQMGCFVPCAEASLPIFHHIFTRIGAADNLAEGLSTFMVEMQEASEILDRCDENSLVILDEIGRGTSTYDGMSLAQSILEHLVKHKKPLVLFATHYHELTNLSTQWPQVHNAHMSIKDSGDGLEFLYKLEKGPANKSYGIHVAELAGLPKSVVKRAKKVLEQLESFSGSSNGQMSFLEMPSADTGVKTDDAAEELIRLKPIEQDLKKISLQQMTPLDALNTIAKWQQDLY